MPRYNTNFVSDSEKKKYLFCDGNTYNTSVYPKLYKILGTNRLPNLNNRVLWGSSAGGTYIEAGLPNITGYFYGINGGIRKSGGEMPNNKGAFSVYGIYYGFMDLGITNYSDGGIYKFDASRSDPIYGASETVQPPAMTVRFYIRAK